MRSNDPARPACIAGFTLLELMIAVAVIGILASIAYPMYADYVTRSRIVDGTTKLGDYRTQMEKYFMDNRSYLNAGACGAALPAVSGNDNFTLACVAAAGPPPTYTVTATGIAARGMAGFSYSVDQANLKTTVSVPAAWSGGGSTCWVLRKDGSC